MKTRKPNSINELGVGAQGSRVLQNLWGKGVIGATDEIILRATQNTGLEITNQFIVPAFQKKKEK